MSADEDLPSVPVVGVGASAGGIEAFREMLAGLPEAPGLAVVFVPHLDPDAESQLAEVLSSDTPLPVEQVSDGTKLERDHVYVVPPGHGLTIEDGTLEARPRERHADDPTGVIDDFLSSLADSHGTRSIGVVLSGNLRDGTAGLRSIREAGGHSIVQDPATAAHADMPRSALEAGVADQMLAPSEIGAEVAAIVAHPLFGAPPQHEPRPEDLGGSQEDLDRIVDLLEARAEIDFSNYKKGTLKRRIQRQILAGPAEDLAGYVDVLESDPEAVDELYKAVLIGVTAFFRDQDTYDDLEEHVFPALLEDRPDDEPVRFWVPGCATGEEAYSLAIALDQHLDTVQGRREVQVFGTDIDEEAIETARSGWYPEAIAEDVPDDVLRRYFTESSGGYEVVESVRGRCIFAVHDLTRDPPFSNMDLISCRNVLIYLEPSLQERVLGGLHYALRSSGYLILADAESPGRAQGLYEPVAETASIYRPKESSGSALAAWAQSRPRGQQQIPETRQAEAPWTGGGGLEEILDEELMDLYGPAAVVVDREGEAVSFRGETGRYLEHDPGEADLQLRHLLRRGLDVKVMQAVREVQEGGSPRQLEDLQVEGPEGLERVDVDVRPLERAGRDDHVLVTFRETGDAGDDDGDGLLKRVRAAVSGLAGGGSESGEPSREELERELERTREELRTIAREYEATNEELRAAHEEALSTNEELQSTNEELETAKEELQSTNEELTTLNQELQERNEQVQRVNDDLRNLLESVDFPIVMVGSKLQIRRFTERAEDVLNLIPSDVGRPLREIRTGFDSGELETVALEVVETFQEQEVDIEDEAGNPYRLKARPYRTTDDQVEGAVLVFLDW